MDLEKIVISELYFPGKLARARLKLDLETGEATFFTSVCLDFWVPMHRSKEIAALKFLESIDDMIGKDNRLIMFTTLSSELRRVGAAHRAFIDQHKRRPPPV